MLSPPSPQNATTCRSRSSSWAPRACGIALDIEPTQGLSADQRGVAHDGAKGSSLVDGHGFGILSDG